MSDTLAVRRGLPLRKIAIAVGVVILLVSVVVGYAWLLVAPQTYTAGGFERFEGAIKTQGVLVKAGRKYEYFVEFTLFRVGPYHVYPEETYTGELRVPNSVGPAQTFTLMTDRETTTQRIKVEWQWEAGSLAAKGNWRPKSVEFSLRRQRDGVTEGSFQRMPAPE